jgi:hypothetical protein
MEEEMGFLLSNKAYVACWQETWKIGDTIENHNGNIIINHGPPTKLCRRGSLGVSIVISREAKPAWERAGAQKLYFGLRILATCLHVEQPGGKIAKLFLVSAYAPIGASTQTVHDLYESDLQRCIDSCNKDEILIVGTDANASCGVRADTDDPFNYDRDQVRGKYGIKHENKAGKRLVALLSANNLCLPSTYFKHRQYATWINPCSKLGHAIDQFLVRQRDRKRVLDCGRFGRLGKPSDHTPTRIRLILATLKPKTQPKTIQIDKTRLKDPHTAAAFIAAVKTYHINDNKDINKSKVAKLEEAMRMAAIATLESKQKRKPSWYKAAEIKLAPAISERNKATKAYRTLGTIEWKARLQRARAEVKKLVKEAKNVWYNERFSKINEHNNSNGRPHNPKAIWDAVKEIRNGMPVTRQVQPMVLKKDQTKKESKLCETPAENAKVMGDNLNAIFNKNGTFDTTAIDAVRQRDPAMWKWLDSMPSDNEIAKAICKLGDEKSGGEAKCYAEYYKALEGDPEARMLIREIIIEFWTSGSFPGQVNIPPVFFGFQVLIR